MLVHPSQDDSQCFASSHLTHGHLEFMVIHYNDLKIQIKMVCIGQQHILNKVFLIKKSYVLFMVHYFIIKPLTYAICLPHKLILLQPKNKVILFKKTSRM